VFAIGYLVLSAFSLKEVVTVLHHPSFEYLVLTMGVPILPLLAVSTKPLTRYVMFLTALGWLGTVGALLYFVVSPQSSLADVTDRALIQVIVASCAVVLVRMPAYMVAGCGYALFGVFLWSTHQINAMHTQDQKEFHDGILKIALQLFGAITVFVVGSYFTETHERRSFLTRRLLADERLKTQKLIANMLPAAITDRLLEKPDVIAEHHEAVTVLFADLVNFTPYAAGRSASEVVGHLNDIFSRFDEIVERAGVEKIKTIGDAYMVAAGLPEFRPDHLEAILELSIQMLDVARALDVELRIGIHTGSAIAGVIGTKKYLYDLWGNTVNTASRLESYGIPGRIQVSQHVVELANPKFKFEERGVLEVKGLGAVKAYLLICPTKC